MDRYGNQFATRVEVNVEASVISADVLYTPQGMFGLAVGGVILSVQYASQGDAIDAAEVILGRIAEGELAVVNLPMDGYGYDEYEGDYPGQVMPTGWDAQDHKALYE